MRNSVCVLVAFAAASFMTAYAQNTGNPAPTPATRAPAQQPSPQETVRPPDSARTSDSNTRTNAAQKNRLQQDRVPPAMRGVGTTGRPDCSKLRGIEKAECERRDTSRDDLPAGKTTTQPKKPPQ